MKMFYIVFPPGKNKPPYSAAVCNNLFEHMRLPFLSTHTVSSPSSFSSNDCHDKLYLLDVYRSRKAEALVRNALAAAERVLKWNLSSAMCRMYEIFFFLSLRKSLSA